MLAVLVIAERRAAQPIMPLRLFGSGSRVGAYLARLLYLGAMIGFFYFLQPVTAGSVLLARCLTAALGLLVPSEQAGRRRDARSSGRPARR